VALRVLDSGPGPPKHFSARAIDRFSAATGAEHRRGRLGLAIVDDRPRARRRVELGSREEGGLDVAIVLPSAGGSAVRAEPRQLAERTNSRAGPRRLLTHLVSFDLDGSGSNAQLEGRRRAVLDRDATIARVRRATTATFALATALVAAFAGLAATSTHSRKVVKATTKKSSATATVQTPSVSPPPLQPSGSSTPSPAPPTQAPTPSSSPPAAVSGGT
jgi:hypothetical protein